MHQRQCLQGGDYGVSATFNVADLSPYEEDDYLYDLRSNHFKQREDDVIQSDTSQLNSASQGSPIAQVQGTSSILQIQKRWYLGSPPCTYPYSFLLFHSVNDIQIM